MDINNKNNIFSLNKNKWNFVENDFRIGGRFPVSNTSKGYHGILKQWWDFYSINFKNPNVLLVSETNVVKKEFQKLYENWNITTVDYYPDVQGEKSDIISDMCSNELVDKYDLIINQATLEHLYNPFGAMKILFNSLNNNGYLINHTHSQYYNYHQYPRDYIRFMIDWWYDLPSLIENIKLLELYEDEKKWHVFTCYQKIN